MGGSVAKWLEGPWPWESDDPQFKYHILLRVTLGKSLSLLGLNDLTSTGG